MTKEVVDDILLKTGDLPWVPMVEGIDFRLLRTCDRTGAWTVIFRCQAGSCFPLHRHLGAGEYLVIKGRMVYRAGEAVTGDYGYEPLDAIHELTSFPEYTELYFTNFGPVLFLDEEGEIVSVLDHQAVREIYETTQDNQNG
ncbi:2,4'-dihydroxyacetophenone dioxygenase family protein [Emcibacter sp.]|uniref:2,4'-dihydroxyacetophenone dioxygenase family protein n=1 Tax=Emcibacter sp. TaxID=1979954 RepID=UPI003A8D000C